MQDTSTPIAAVRFVSIKQRSSSSAHGEICRMFFDNAGVVNEHTENLQLSPNTYNYLTCVEVQPGDLVMVRQAEENSLTDRISLAVVAHLATGGDYCPTRTIIAKLDFGLVLLEKRRAIERLALTKELARRVREIQAKEDITAKAEQLAATDPAIAEMLTKLKEMPS